LDEREPGHELGLHRSCERGQLRAGSQLDRLRMEPAERGREPGAVVGTDPFAPELVEERADLTHRLAHGPPASGCGSAPPGSPPGPPGFAPPGSGCSGVLLAASIARWIWSAYCFSTLLIPA